MSITEDYAYLLFYHPTQVNEKGDVLFHTDLVRMDIDILNAEKIFKNAKDVLEGEIPIASMECGFCRWVDERNGL